MKVVNIVTLLLVILGGINWLLIGAFDYDLAARVFGGSMSIGSRTVFVIIGLAALFQVVSYVKLFATNKPAHH